MPLSTLHPFVVYFRAYETSGLKFKIWGRLVATRYSLGPFFKFLAHPSLAQIKRWELQN